MIDKGNTQLYKELTDFLMVDDSEIRKIRYIGLATGVADVGSDYSRVDILTLINRLAVYVMFEPEMLLNEVNRAMRIKSSSTISLYSSTFVNVLLGDDFYSADTLELLDANMFDITTGIELGREWVKMVNT